jgi:hypothetical protein
VCHKALVEVDLKKMTTKCTADRVALFLFVASAICPVFSYGVVVGKYHIFPYRVFAHAAEGLRESRTMMTPELPEYYKRAVDRAPTPSRNIGEVQRLPLGYRGLVDTADQANLKALAESARSRVSYHEYERRLK